MLMNLFPGTASGHDYKLQVTIFLGLIIMSMLTGYSQTIEVQGTVKAFGTYPINNAELKAQKSGSVAHTNKDGSFNIECMLTDVLFIRAAGFDRLKIKIKSQDTLDVNLIYSNEKASFEKVMNGAHMSSADLKYAIKHFPLKGQKDYSIYTNIYECIRGEVPQVLVDGTSISSKTPNTLMSSQEVLIILNGMQTKNISFISPSEVKSIKYIQGPEASIYGSRGANGVLEIVLK